LIIEQDSSGGSHLVKERVVERIDAVFTVGHDDLSARCLCDNPDSQIGDLTEQIFSLVRFQAQLVLQVVQIRVEGGVGCCLKA
jgi:hypothetical protein